MVFHGRRTPYFKYSVDKDLKMEDSNFSLLMVKWADFFFLLCLFCIVFPRNERNRVYFSQRLQTPTVSQDLFLFFFFQCRWQQLRSGHVKEDEWVKYGAGKARRWEDSYIQLGQTRVTNRHHGGGRRDDGGCNSLVLPRYCNNMCWFFYFITC